MSPDDERFVAKTTVLIESVRHHMDEEEQEWFPQVREGLGRKQAQEPRRADARGQGEGAPEAFPAERAGRRPSTRSSPSP